jgi:rhodanese-related sulfurtransferase
MKGHYMSPSLRVVIVGGVAAGPGQSAFHARRQADSSWGSARSLPELPRDKEIVTFCKISLRGYEAALILKAAGFPKVRVMDGGVVVWPFEKLS